jgi:hypothetical protein
VSNKHKPHVIVLPEDDANRQIANGFLLDPSIKPRNIQVLNPAGGWGKVLDSFLEDHVAGLRKWPQRHLHHPLLAHNAAERARLNTKVKSILF